MLNVECGMLKFIHHSSFIIPSKTLIVKQNKSHQITSQKQLKNKIDKQIIHLIKYLTSTLQKCGSRKEKLIISKLPKNMYWNIVINHHSFSKLNLGEKENDE